MSKTVNRIGLPIKTCTPKVFNFWGAYQLSEFYVLLFDFWLITNLIDGINGNEGFGVHFADIIHKLLILLLIDNGNDLFVHHILVGTNGLIQRGTAVNLVKNIMNDIIDFG